MIVQIVDAIIGNLSDVLKQFAVSLLGLYVFWLWREFAFLDSIYLRDGKEKEQRAKNHGNLF